MYDRGYDDDFENDFVVSQRRHKERAAAAFLDDLADIRRKRRDMQDRIFDVIDLNAEIEKAKTTLEAADIAFQKHANKFDNTENCEDTPDKRAPRTIKFIKVPNVDIESCVPYSRKSKQERQNSSLPEPDAIEDPLDKLALLPLKRRFLKRKKSVSF
ncbi:uncharacterized protein LOC143356637 [Halictus rubicundus]|uniref:uncharacterized protein LOC143356637 n=1 Tax=Halictus rubicundus TaxID=77578 RepID=UPI00403556A4